MEGGQLLGEGMGRSRTSHHDAYLPRSQQKLADMKQESQLMKESVWKDDREVLQCQICQAGFSVARRKVNVLLFSSVIV